MISAGNLKTFGLIDIFQVIRENNKDCILAIENNSTVYAVYFYKGNPIYIRKVKKSFFLYMDIDFESVLKRDKISKSDLFKILATYLPMVLKMKEGRFSITSGFIKYPNDIKPIVEIERLIMLLSRNLTSKEVDRKITNLDIVFEKTEKVENIEKFGLSDKEKKILSLIDGKNKVSDIITKVHFDRLLKEGSILDLSDENVSQKLYSESELDVKRALYGFLASELIRKQKSIKKSENIFDRILSYLETKPLIDNLKEKT